MDKSNYQRVYLLISIITTGGTHENNWLEKGPNSNPPTPW